MVGIGILIRGDNPGAQIRVGCVHSMESDDVGSGSRNESCELAHQVDRVEDHSGGSVSPRSLELKDHSSIPQSLQVVLCQRGSKDVPGEFLHPLAIT